jgi:Planctomycete cytochrome C
MQGRQIKSTNMKKSTTLFLAIAAALALTPLAVRADDDMDPSKLPPASTKTGLTYDADIKPILDTSCIKCHKGDRPKGRLHLDTLEGILKGGKDGVVVVPGNVAKSPLVFAVAHVGDEDDFMPPPVAKSKINPLTADQVALIRAWVEQGAK